MKAIFKAILLLSTGFLLFNPKYIVAATSPEEIYDLTLMEKNNIKVGSGADYESIDSLIESIIEEYNVNTDNIGLAYYNFSNDQHYYINPDLQMIAASTVKVPIVALYIDLIVQGNLTYESSIPFVEYKFAEETGETSSNMLESSYPLSDLMFKAITYSDNAAWYSLMAYYNNFGSHRQALLDFINYYDVPDLFYSDNYNSAYMAEQWLIKIALDPTYQSLIDNMKSTEPHQLFTSYVKSGMANKYGRVDEYVHDTGIYYENDIPQYVLAVYTKDINFADGFLEVLNLRINEWYRANFLAQNLSPLDVNENESAIKITDKVEESEE